MKIQRLESRVMPKVFEYGILVTPWQTQMTWLNVVSLASRYWREFNRFQDSETENPHQVAVKSEGNFRYRVEYD